MTIADTLSTQDQTESADAACAATSPSLQRLRMSVQGLNCANCAQSAEKALRGVRGVEIASVNFATERADVRMDPQVATIEDLIHALVGAGYSGELWQPGQSRDTDDKAKILNETQRLFIAILLTLPLVAPMLLGDQFMLSPSIQLALAAPVQFWLGARFYHGAWNAIKNRMGNMDVLVALGTTSAFVYSVLTMSDLVATSSGHLYFEASAVIITLVLVGKWLEDRAKRGAGEAIRLLMDLRPRTARIQRNGTFVEIPAEDLINGDVVLVQPGERVPVDGRVLKGRTDVDVSSITGESMPVDCGLGDDVYGGSLNGNGAIEIEATSDVDNSMLAKIIDLVEGAQSGKAPVQRLVDRVSAVFVPSVIALSLVTLLGWLLAGGTFEQALIASIAVLVIACPCALGLATPTALVAGLGAAAKSGILIRDIEALERASKIDLVVFDKTGTLTEGAPKVVSIEAEHPEVVLRLAAAVQVSSEHILGKAILKESSDRNISLPSATNFENWIGEGVSAIVEGKKVFVGNKALTRRFGVNDPMAQRKDAQPGHTTVFVGQDGAVIGRITLADQLRPQSQETIEVLRARGIDTLMLSGDARETVAAIGDQLRIGRALGGLKPDDKVAAIDQEMRAGRTTAMVGDGINDAPALASADVGIAMGGGTDVAIATAGITLMREDPRLIPASIDVAKATERKIKQNLVWAFVYNVSGLPLAALGLLSPTFAAAAMAASSLSVVSNSLLLRRWKPKR